MLYSISNNDLTPFHVKRIPIANYYGFKTLLVPLKNFETNNEIKWFDSYYKILINNKLFICPTKLLKQLYTPLSTIRHIFVRKDEKCYLEYSFNALNRPKYCLKGHIIISSSDQCPLMDSCNDYINYKGKCYYYQEFLSPISRLYSVKPLLAVKIEPIEVIKEINLGKMIDLKLYIVDAYIIFLGVSFITLELSDFPEFILSLERPFVVELCKIPSLSIIFDEDLLEEVVVKILSNGNLPILKYKFHIFEKIKEKYNEFSVDYQTEILESLHQDYLRVIQHRYYRMPLTSIYNSEFIKYCKFTVLHTLSHLLKALLPYKLGLSTKEVIINTNLKGHKINLLLPSYALNLLINQNLREAFNNSLIEAYNFYNKIKDHGKCIFPKRVSNILERFYVRYFCSPPPHYSELLVHHSLKRVISKDELLKLTRELRNTCWDACKLCIPNSCNFSKMTCYLFSSFSLTYHFMRYMMRFQKAYIP